MAENMRVGFVLDRNGHRILPITHANLVIDDDGNPVLNSLSNLNNRLFSVNTLSELPTNSNLIEGAICYVIGEKKYYSYTVSAGWQVMSTGGSGGYSDADGYSHIWIGSEPPTNKNMIWIDTSRDGIVEGETDTNLLYSLLDTVAEMQVEIASLKGRIKYLEEHGVINPNPNPGEEEYEYGAILLEDGSILLLEDGNELLLEKQSEPVVTTENTILLEDGSELLLEDGNKILLEMK